MTMAWTEHVQIRPIGQEDKALMKTFLYAAIFVPEGEAAPPRKIVNEPALALYVQDFGAFAGDCGLAAVVGDEVVAMAWVRIVEDYGHIDDETPSLAISVLPPWRGQGIGTRLLTALLKRLRSQNVRAVSLSVQVANPALHLYQRLGFDTVRTHNGEAIMRCSLQ